MISVLTKANETPELYRQKALKSLDRLPPLAPAVGQLLSKLAFREVNYGDLAELVEKDALLCAHILRTVNSAAYARAKTITSVAQAMSLLGTTTLRRSALGFALGNLFPRSKAAPGWSRMRFNLHSGATGILTEAIVEALPVEKKEGAFVAGMLHDLGRLLIAVGLPERYETISAMNQVTEKPVFECERELIFVDHAELSGLALKQWGLPEVVYQSVAYHHMPLDKRAPWMAGVLCKADRFVNHLGISILPPRPLVGDPPSLDIPGFEYDQRAVLEKFEREWKILSEFFA
jgi:HD-like signal output (HDOD) protein